METESQIIQIKTVKIFKTSVRNEKEAAKIVTALLRKYPLYKINFDLEDEDCILRIENDQFEIASDAIIKYMIALCYSCIEIK